MNRILLICSCTFILPFAARADVAYVPPAVLIDKADIVVIGKVGKIDDAGAGPNQEFAIIDIREVLKGDPKLKSVKQLQPALKGARLSHRVSVNPGEQGIFILNKVPQAETYRIGHPSQVVVFTDKNEKEVVAAYRKLVEDRAKIAGGKEVNGLVARAEVVKEGGQTTLRFALKNVTDKPITICTWIGGRQMEVKWIGPDGKAIESPHYEWMKAARIRALIKEDFVAIPAGGVLFFGPRGASDNGFSFSLPEGESKITLSYVSKADGREFKIDGVWTGTVTANEVSIKK
jgi:hypothetical protein